MNKTIHSQQQIRGVGAIEGMQRPQHLPGLQGQPSKEREASVERGMRVWRQDPTHQSTHGVKTPPIRASVIVPFIG